ncbi:MAG TPA: hypothetical protein VNE82_02050 [Candidatus Binataceae bacterium]|nr:hypothetical protein [Candidatus Binataceae bacterium]
MKSLVKCGLAALMVLATAMPAMARSWVVCVDTTKDARFSSEATATVPPTPNFFVAAAPVYPASAAVVTAISTATDCTQTTVGKAPVGTFFAFGGFVGGLPQSTTADTADGFYVVWHFRIDGKGAFDTTGPTRTTPTYSQTITGSTNPGLVPTHGRAKVTNLSNGTTGTLLTFKITTPEGNNL